MKPVSLGLRLGAAVGVLTALLTAPAIGATVVRTMVYHQLTTFTNNGVQGTTRPLLLSANGQKMVFTRPWYGSPRSNLIYTVNFDGSALTLADSWAIDPGAEVDISADGSKIISYQSGLCRVAAADGSSASTLVQLEGGYSTFRLSSDGAFVYFLVNGDTALLPSHQSIEAGVYRMGANGTNRQMLANRTSVAQFFGTTPDQIGFGGYGGTVWIALSGNGARLLFQCYKGGYRLIGMNSDGSGLREYPLGTVPDIYAFQIGNFGLSGDGNKLFYHVMRNTGPQEVGVFDFDGTGQRGLLTNNINLFGEVMPLNHDGSKLLLGGTGWLLNTEGSGQLELGWSARWAANNVLQWGLFHGVMDSNATHFAYLTPAGADGGHLQIGSAELNPVNLGLAPTITSPSANPAYITTNGPGPVFAFQPAPTNSLVSGGGAQAGILLDGMADPAIWQGSSLHDDGSYGDAVKGDGIYSDNTGYYNSTPAIGPRTLRYKAELLAGDGKYHATAIDVAPFFVVAQAPTNPPSPVLAITFVERAALVSWSASATGFVLEATSGLESPIFWSTITNASVLQGGRWVVNVGAGERARFFRLRSADGTLTIIAGQGTISATVGGTIVLPGGDVMLTVPPGAIEQDTEIQILHLQQAADGDIPAFGQIILTPNGLVFKKPVTLSIRVPEGIADPESATLQLLSSLHPPVDVGGEISRFQALTNFVYDASTHMLWVPLEHFSVLTYLFEENVRAYLVYDFDGKYLQKADLLFALTGGGTWFPGHVGMYLGGLQGNSQINDGKTIIESTSEAAPLHQVSGVQLAELAPFKKLQGQHTYMGARRPRFEVTQDERDRIATWALSKLGTLYDYLGSPFITSGGVVGYSCVGFTESAYESVGKSIVPGIEEFLLLPIRQYAYTRAVNEVTVAPGEVFTMYINGVVRPTRFGAYSDDSKYYTVTVTADPETPAADALRSGRAIFKPELLNQFTFKPSNDDADLTFVFRFTVDASQSGLGQAPQTFFIHVKAPPLVSTRHLEISWKLYDELGSHGYYTSFDPQPIASGAGTNFSTAVTNRVTVAGSGTNVVTTLAGSLIWTPIVAGNPFDVTCALSASKGAAPGDLTLGTFSASLSTLLPAALWLKAGFRPVAAGSDLFKADFTGSQNFQGWNKSFLSADVSGEGFAGNFLIQNSDPNAICGHNGKLCFDTSLHIGDPTYIDGYYTYPGSYVLKIQALFK